MMLEELERRNYTDATIRHYLRFVEEFAQHFGKSPDQLSLEHLRSYQAYLLKQRKLSPGSVEQRVSALRFFFVRTLHRHEFREFLPYPRVRRKLPNILSREEVARLIDASNSLFQRTLRMVLYGTGMRRSEVARLKIADIDSQRMVIHVVNGKGGKDRDLPLSPARLEALRAYWRWLKPRTWLFPSPLHRDCEQPITDKIVWRACAEARKRAGIRKRVSPHLIRHRGATHLREAGTDLRTIQLLLGHEDLETTARYLHLSQQYLHQVANPIDDLKMASVDQSRRLYHPPLHP
jgi:integrase/recombinase XerD